MSMDISLLLAANGQKSQANASRKSCAIQFNRIRYDLV